MNFSGIIVGAATFLIIGICHPIVIKMEYHWGKGSWWILLVAGLAFSAASIFVNHEVASTVLGAAAFSCFWGILEVFEQEKRVLKVLGEVEKPGRYAIDKDAVTILDAIGTAGDLTIYGKRESVKVLRNENGKMLTYEVNLCSAADLIASPAYYIRQNDVIYVDPNDVRARQSTVNGNNVRSTSFWISLTSLAASITNTIVIIATRAGSGK